MSVLIDVTTGTIDFIGIVRDRATSLASDPVRTGDFDYGGLIGDCHSGLIRPSCLRLSLVYPHRTPIRNTRQISLVSREELGEIAAAMGIDRLEPEWLGANLMVSGIPHLSLLPPSSRLVFGAGLSLTVDLENPPCNHPARVIARHEPGGVNFRAVARNRRGLCAWVEKPGRLQVGDAFSLWIPAQPPHPVYGRDPAPRSSMQVQ